VTLLLWRDAITVLVWRAALDTNHRRFSCVGDRLDIKLGWNVALRSLAIWLPSSLSGERESLEDELLIGGG
jgi:hypothetical protein